RIRPEDDGRLAEVGIAGIGDTRRVILQITHEVPLLEWTPFDVRAVRGELGERRISQRAGVTPGSWILNLTKWDANAAQIGARGIVLVGEIHFERVVSDQG